MRSAVSWPTAQAQLTTAHYAPFPDKLAFAFDIVSFERLVTSSQQDGVLKQGKFVLPQAKRVMKLLTGQDGQLPR